MNIAPTNKLRHNRARGTLVRYRRISFDACFARRSELRDEMVPHLKGNAVYACYAESQGN
jgi:hypothetical protein